MNFPPSFLLKGIDALVQQDGKAALDFLKEFFAAAASGEPPAGEAPSGEAPAAEPGDDPQALSRCFATLATRNLDGAVTVARASAPKRGTRSRTFSTPDGDVTLSARELRNCAEAKADPQVYANNKALQAKARAGRA